MECVNEGGVSNFKEIPAGCGANEVCRAVAAGVGVCECAEDYIRVNDVCEGDLIYFFCINLALKKSHAQNFM